MASRRTRDDRPRMIHCEYCGEDYASTYKHCPFCDEVPLDEEDYDIESDAPPRPRGGKRLVTNTRGGGYGRGPSPLRLAGIILSLAIIIAAVIIVISVIIPLVSKGGSVDTPPGTESIQPTESVQPSTNRSAPRSSIGWTIRETVSTASGVCSRSASTNSTNPRPTAERISTRSAYRCEVS